MNLLPGLPEDILAKTKEPLISQVGITTFLIFPATLLYHSVSCPDTPSNSVHPEHRGQMSYLNDDQCHSRLQWL